MAQKRGGDDPPGERLQKKRVVGDPGSSGSDGESAPAGDARVLSPDVNTDGVASDGGVGEEPGQGSENDGTSAIEGYWPFWSSLGEAGCDETVEDLEDIELPAHELAFAEPCPDPKYAISAPFQKYHRSWGHFLLYKNDYEDSNNIKTYVKYTYNVGRRNEYIRTKLAEFEEKKALVNGVSRVANGRAVKLRKPRNTEEIPAHCVVWQRTLLCTHGGSRANRGSGCRPLQQIRSTKCPYRFVAEVRQWNGFWVVVVTSGRFFHNHRVSEFIFEGYAHNRVLQPDAPARRDVEIMIRGQGKPTEMFDYLLEVYNKPIHMKDIHNYIASYKKEKNGDVSEDIRVAEWLVRFHESVEGNAVSVTTNRDGHTATISMTTRFMRQLTQRFPEVLLVDCTHGVTVNNYQLCSLMVMDESGAGQFVQHTLMETNSIWHLEQVAKHFVQTNPCFENVRVIVADKDLKEVDVMTRFFPNARILLCSFHVLKWLKKEVPKQRFGPRKPEEVDHLYELIYKMVYAVEESAYRALLAKFQALAVKTADATAKKDLWTYFETNWARCSEMWAYYARQDLPHLDNNTNNRLESNFGKLKKEMPDTQSVSECLNRLRKRANRDELKYKTRTNFVGTRVHKLYDDELNAVLQCCTPWVTEAIKGEYERATRQGRNYTITEVGDSFALVRYSHLCEVDKRSWRGTCGFAQTMKLPCRHVIAVRDRSGLTPKIPTFAMDERWSIRAHTLDEAIDSSIDTYRHTKQPRISSAPLSRNERYHLVHPVLDQISDVLVGFGTTRVQCEVRRLKAYLSSLLDDDPRLEGVSSSADTAAAGEDAAAPCVVEQDVTAMETACGSEPDEAPMETTTGSELDEEEDVTGFAFFNDDVDEDLALAQPTTSTCLSPTSVVSSDAAAEEPSQANIKPEPVVEPTTSDESVFIDLCDDSDEDELTSNGEPAGRSTCELDESTVDALVDEVLEPSGQAAATRPPLFSIKLRKKVPRPGKPHQGKMNLRPARHAAAESGDEVGEVLRAVESATDLSSMKKNLDRIVVKVVASKGRDKSTTVRPHHESNVVAAPLLCVLPRKLVQVSKKLLADYDDANGGESVDTVDDDGVRVPGVGVFSRHQLLQMQAYYVLQDDVVAGLDTVAWLREFEAPDCDVAMNILQQLQPDNVLPGYERQDIRCRGIYRARRELWFGEDVIHAYGLALQREMKNCRIVTGASVSSSPRAPEEERSLSKTVVASVVSSDARLTCIPIHFGSGHWACITVDRLEKKITTYDSLGKPRAKTTLAKIASSLMDKLADGCGLPFEVDVRLTPRQSDDFSCGLYVCLFMQSIVYDTLWESVDSCEFERASIVCKILNVTLDE